MEFKIRENGFQEIKKVALKKIIPMILLAAIGGLSINYFNPNSQPVDKITFFISIPIIAIILIYAVNKGLNRQKVLSDSYKLTIDGKKIIREQMNTPTIFIYHEDIKYITKNTEGLLVIGGDSKKNFISVPSQIENPKKIEQLLNQISPIAQAHNKSFLEKYILVYVAVVVGLFAAVAISNNKFIVGVAGTILIPILIFSFFEVRRSKNIDKRIKSSIWFIVLPLLAIAVKMYYVFTGLA